MKTSYIRLYLRKNVSMHLDTQFKISILSVFKTNDHLTKTAKKLLIKRDSELKWRKTNADTAVDRVIIQGQVILHSASFTFSSATNQSSLPDLYYQLFYCGTIKRFHVFGHFRSTASIKDTSGFTLIPAAALSLSTSNMASKVEKPGQFLFFLVRCFLMKVQLSKRVTTQSQGCSKTTAELLRTLLSCIYFTHWTQKFLIIWRGTTFIFFFLIWCQKETLESVSVPFLTGKEF